MCFNVSSVICNSSSIILNVNNGNEFCALIYFSIPYTILSPSCFGNFFKFPFFYSLFSFFNKYLLPFSTIIFDQYVFQCSFFFIFLIHYKHLCFECVQQSPSSQLHSSRSNLWPLKELFNHFFFISEQKYM